MIRSLGYAALVVIRFVGAVLVVMGTAYFLEVPNESGWEAAGAFLGGIIGVLTGIIALAVEFRPTPPSKSPVRE